MNVRVLFFSFFIEQVVDILFTACHTASWYLDPKNQSLLGGADTADDGVTALSPNHVPAWRS